MVLTSSCVLICSVWVAKPSTKDDPGGLQEAFAVAVGKGRVQGRFARKIGGFPVKHMRS